MDPCDKSDHFAEELFAAYKRPGPPQLHYFEVWSSPIGELCTRTGTVDVSQLGHWLSLNEGYEILTDDEKPVKESNVILRLVGCDFWGEQSGFEMIREAFELHETSEEAIKNKNGAYGRYLTRGKGSAEIDTFTLVFKVANCINIGYDAISLNHNLKTKTTRGFVQGLLDVDIINLIDHLSARQDINLFQQPLLIPSHVYQNYRRRAEYYRMSVDDRLHQAEFVIGYAVPGYLAGQPDQYFSKESGHIAFEDTSRSLHSCSTEIGAIIHVSTFAKELGLFLQQTGRELDRTELSRPTDNVHNVDVLRYKESLEQKIEFSINLYTSILSQTAILKQRVQNHINLTFSLIAQDENRVARSMARESALIAVATKRDSTAMKTIALLTIVFLPPTFVATFFSMTMFDWKPQDQDSGVASKYLWVYWVVSIPLTAFVLLCWRVWLKMEDKKYQTELNTAKLQNPGRPKEYTLTLSGDVRANRRRQAHSPGSIAWSDA